MEPIVPVAAIRAHARQAAQNGESQANPYLAGSAAALRWEAEYAQCVGELEAETV